MIMLQGFVKVFHEFENDTLIEGIKWKTDRGEIWKISGSKSPYLWNGGRCGKCYH